MTSTTPAHLRTVVVGYLPTPEGAAAFELATSWAVDSGARLVVVNTGRHGDNSHPNFASAHDLDAIDAELTAAGVEHVLVQPTDGRSAAASILSAAQAHAADLVVIGLRRRTAVGKAVAGSTAQQILFEAPCPVVTVKARART